MATTFSDIRQTIESYFNTQWASHTDIAWSNVKYKPTTGASFVMFTILGGVEENIGLNNAGYRQSGLIDVAIFTPIGQGSDPAYDLADRVSDIFRGVQTEGITFRGPSVSGGRIEDEWFRLNVTIPYWTDNSYV